MEPTLSRKLALAALLPANNLVQSISRSGNCRDNALI